MYSGHELEGYSFDQDFNVYYHNGLRYRKLNQPTTPVVWLNPIAIDCYI
ncbi:MAG: hypothetical protein EZS28_045573, partial [Streblomastix strix]